MMTDAEWFRSFDAVGVNGVFGRGRTQRDLGDFGVGNGAVPEIPSDSPLSKRFGLDPKYLRIDLFSKTINNVHHEFPEWHDELKQLLPEEKPMNVKFFKWITGPAVIFGPVPPNDDIGDAHQFPKSTLQWLINKFIRSELNRSVLKLIEFSGPFSPAILGQVGDGDQSELMEFIRYSEGLSHLKIGHRLVPPEFLNDHCKQVDPAALFDYHWHVPLIGALHDKWLKHLELTLGHFDAESLAQLLLSPMPGILEKVSLTFQPMHDDVQLGQLLHTLAANAFSNLTHLEIRLASCCYNRYGRLPRFQGPENGPHPEQDQQDLGLANDTYISAYLFDRVSSLKVFTLSFGEILSGHPLLTHNFGPDMRRFLANQQSREEEVRVQFEGIRVIGCKFRTFLLYLRTILPRLEVTVAPKMITVKYGSARAIFNITRATDCSTGNSINYDCCACRSLYPVVLHSLSMLLLKYRDDQYRKVESIPTEFIVQECVLDNFTTDINACASRQPWVWWCYPEIDVQDGRVRAWFEYKRTGRIVDVVFRTERCELRECCQKCWPHVVE